MPRKPSPYQREVARRMKEWLRKHPKAPPRKKVQVFDKIADEVKGE